jgi:hypothetical protein
MHESCGDLLATHTCHAKHPISLHVARRIEPELEEPNLLEVVPCSATRKR